MQHRVEELKMKQLILGLLFISLYGNLSQAEVIFQDNFDNSPDWQSNQTISKSQPSGEDISWVHTRMDKCSTFCGPKNWTGYRAASSLWSDDRRKDTYVINAQGARGGTGKGITYNVENGMDVGAGWTGGGLNLWLGEQGYNDLYIRMFIKYPPEWIWTGSPHSPLQKIMRISVYNEELFSSTRNPGEFGSAGYNYPVFYPDWTYNSVWGYGYLVNSTRLAPDYDYSDDNNRAEFGYPRLPEDNQWHCYEFHVKMNSQFGVADGIADVYLDDELKASRHNIVWKKAGSNNVGWNWLFFLDNVYIGAYPASSHYESPLYMDDVVVSTSYIGSSYVIAGKMGLQSERGMCNDGVDNDGDGAVDSSDAECASVPAPNTPQNLKLQ